MEFTTTSKTISGTGVKMLTYAGPGLGKTVLCATAPQPLILSAESGLLSLSKGNLERLFGVGNPSISYELPVVNITTMRQLDEAYNWAAQNVGKGYFQTICLDSISEIAEILITTLKATTKDPRQAYGELLGQLLPIIKQFRDLPVNVYMSCKQERIVDGSSGGVTYGLLMPGAKLSQELPHLFDEIFNLQLVTDQQGKAYRVLQTQPSFAIMAKDRSGALQMHEPPNLTHIINKIRSI